jgi:L-amino acid N-acyltransferase
MTKAIASAPAASVRRAVRGDVPAILDIYNDAVLNTTASYDYEPRSLESRLAWFDEHERDDFPVFVAEIEGRVVGWSSLSRFRERRGYRFTAENSIYVMPEWQGQGIGKRLLAPLIDAARQGSWHAIIAAIDGANQASIRLHERFGFVKVGHFKEVGHKFDRWLDVVYMELLLR